MTNAESSCSVPSRSPSLFAVSTNIPVPPSPLVAPETTSFAPFASPIPPTYGQPQTPLRHVHSGPSMVHHCQSQQYQPYPAYLESYMSTSRYPNSTWPSAFPTIEKLKDNCRTMRGEPTLLRTHERMIPRNHKITGTTSPQKVAKGIMQSQIM